PIDSSSPIRLTALPFSPCEPPPLSISAPGFRCAAARRGARCALRARARRRGPARRFFFHHQPPDLREGGGRVAPAPPPPDGLRRRAPLHGRPAGDGAAQGAEGAGGRSREAGGSR